MHDGSPAAPADNRRPLHRVVNALVSVAVIAVCLFGYTLLGERKRPERAKRPKPNAVIVSTKTLAVHEGPVDIATNGVVVPVREIRLATEVAGRVVAISPRLRAGRMVDAGELLIQLDPTQYELEVNRLRAQAAQEGAEVAAVDVGIRNTEQLLELAQQQVALATAERRRIDSLVSQKAASVSEVDAIKRAELTAKAALVELDNRRRELNAEHELIVQKRALTDVQLQRAQLDLTRCTVTSPIRGRVVSSTVEEQSFVGAGMTFVTIEDTSAVEVRVNLTADQMVWVWRSNGAMMDVDRDLPPVPATISCDLGATTCSWDAVLQRIDGAGLDLQTRTYPCLFRVDSPEASLDDRATQRLTRGMFVDVVVATDPDRTLYQVPENAIRPGQRLWFNASGKLRVVPVTVVCRLPDAVVIDLNATTDDESWLAAATVIVSPMTDPTEGMAVATTSNPTDRAGRLAEHPERDESETSPTDSPSQPRSSEKVAG